MFRAAIAAPSSAPPLVPKPHIKSDSCQPTKVSNAGVKWTGVRCVKTVTFKMYEINETILGFLGRKKKQNIWEPLCLPIAAGVCGYYC